MTSTSPTVGGSSIRQMPTADLEAEVYRCWQSLRDCSTELIRRERWVVLTATKGDFIVVTPNTTVVIEDI